MIAQYSRLIKRSSDFSDDILDRPNEAKLDYDSLRVSFGLICLTFGREDVDAQGINGLNTNTPLFTHLLLSSKRFQDPNSIDAVENASTCTGTTMGGDLNRCVRANKNRSASPREETRLETRWTNFG